GSLDSGDQEALDAGDGARSGEDASMGEDAPADTLEVQETSPPAEGGEADACANGCSCSPGALKWARAVVDTVGFTPDQASFAALALPGGRGYAMGGFWTGRPRFSAPDIILDPGGTGAPAEFHLARYAADGTLRWVARSYSNNHGDSAILS